MLWENCPILPVKQKPDNLAEKEEEVRMFKIWGMVWDKAVAQTDNETVKESQGVQ